MSKTFDPTAEQIEVIESTEPSLIVTAAAGAGKTAVLVERYLKHVEDGLEPDQILTITFTKKAAAEMKKRIVGKLRHRSRFREAQIAETGPIQTIHSFCERMLRENALEAGLDPRFEIAADNESVEMTERAVRHAMASPLDESPEAERLISYLAGQRSYGAGTSPYARAEGAVREVLSRLRGCGLLVDEVEEHYTRPERLARLFEQKILEALPLPVARRMGKQVEGTLHDRLKQAFVDWGERPPKWIAAKADAIGDQEALEHTAGLFQLAHAAWIELEQEMTREQKLDFTALESRALRLVERSPTTKARLQRQYCVVMVDEAQDVNPVQHRLLDSMEIAAEMLVGDKQQSIYGFRLADPRIFEDRVRGSDARRLSVNKRSEAGILRFVDLVFGRLWSDYAPMTPPPSPLDLSVEEESDYSGVELWLQDDRSATETALLVRQMLEQQQTPLSGIAILVRRSSFAAEMLRSLQSVGIPARITGGTEQYYARLEIRDLANTLRALGDPYDDFAFLAMLRSPVVGLSLDAIALLARQRPIMHSIEAFESPVEDDRPKLKRFLQWFVPLSGFADRLSACEALSELFAISDYLPSLARRRNAGQLLANVRKLLRLAADEPELGPLAYAARIREIQRLKHREGDAPAEDEKAELVTITTIHKAKGLEWPVVIVPDVHQPIGRRTNEIEIDPRKRLAVARFGKRGSLYHAWLADERNTREGDEEMRLLYVAFTRAKHRLCVVAHGSAKSDTPAKRIASAIGLGKTVPAGFVTRSIEPDQPS